MAHLLQLQIRRIGANATVVTAVLLNGTSCQ